MPFEIPIQAVISYDLSFQNDYIPIRNVDGSTRQLPGYTVTVLRLELYEDTDGLLDGAAMAGRMMVNQDFSIRLPLPGGNQLFIGRMVEVQRNSERRSVLAVLRGNVVTQPQPEAEPLEAVKGKKYRRAISLDG